MRSEAQDMLGRPSFLSLLLLAMLVNILSQTVHETGHHLVYQVGGHEPVWGFTKLVQMSETTPANPDEWVRTEDAEGEHGWLKLSSPVEGRTERVLAAAAGPLAGLLGAALALLIASRSGKQSWQQIGLAFALSTSLVAVLYYARAASRSGGDEFDIAVQLGVTKAAVEVPLALAYAACLFLSLRLLPSWRTRLVWLGTVLLGSALTGVLMVTADPYVINQVDKGSPWFHPILGYSLPVLLANFLAIIGLWAWSRRAEAAG